MFFYVKMFCTSWPFRSDSDSRYKFSDGMAAILDWTFITCISGTTYHRHPKPCMHIPNVGHLKRSLLFLNSANLFSFRFDTFLVQKMLILAQLCLYKSNSWYHSNGINLEADMRVPFGHIDDRTMALLKNSCICLNIFQFALYNCSNNVMTNISNRLIWMLLLCILSGACTFLRNKQLHV